VNASERFDRDLGDLMAEVAQPRFPDYFDEALDRAVAKRQRPAWTFPERWFPMDILSRRRPLVPALPSRPAGLLLLLLLLLAVTVAIGVGALLLQQRPAPPFGLASNGLMAYSQGGDIYTTDPHTGEVRLIVGGPTEDFAPGFTSDGTQVIFIRGIQLEPQEVIAVMMVDADGSNVRTIVEPEVAGELHWGYLSPDGRLYAVANSAEGVPRLSVVDVSTGERTPLEVPVEAGSFEWLPDSSGIVFRGVEGDHTIYTVGADGTGFRELTSPRTERNYNDRMQVSHDGRYLGHNARVDGTHMILLYDMQSGQTRSIEPPGDRPGHVGHPVFSTDSQLVAYVRYEEPSTAQVMVAPLESAPDGAVEIGPEVRVAANRIGLIPQFSPDSTTLLITSETGEIWLADVESGTYDRLELSKDEFEISWQRQAP
jgi:Tol biopolymer transport system component